MDLALSADYIVKIKESEEREKIPVFSSVLNNLLNTGINFVPIMIGIF